MRPVNSRIKSPRHTLHDRPKHLPVSDCVNVNQIGQFKIATLFINPAGMKYTDIVNNPLDVKALGYTYGFGVPGETVPVDYPGRNLYLAALYGAPLALEAAGLGRLVVVNETAAGPSTPMSITLEANKAVLLPEGTSIARPGTI